MVGGRRASSAGTSSGPAASSAANGSGPSWGSQCGPFHHARARGSQVRPVREPATEREHVEATAGAEDRVRLGAWAVQDAVARAHRVRAPVLPADPLAVEDVEELLLVGVHVDRHRALAGGDPVAAEPDVACAGGRGQAPAPFRAVASPSIDDAARRRRSG